MYEIEDITENMQDYNELNDRNSTWYSVIKNMEAHRAEYNEAGYVEMYDEEMNIIGDEEYNEEVKEEIEEYGK